MEHSEVGLIGIGLVGAALAERFLQAGLRVHGYDADAARLSAFTGIREANAASVAAACRVIVLSLPTTEVVREVLAEADAALQPGAIILDTTTGEPDTTAALGLALQQRGVSYVDATIAGSSAQVRAGDVIVMLGGELAAVRECEPLLRCFARQSFHLGPCGAGARMKLVVNLVLGLNRAVLAEGLAFARCAGIDPRLALEVLQAGPAFSRVMETKGQKMIDHDLQPQARLAQHLKDVHLILAEARKHGARTPLSDLHQKLLDSLVCEGFGDEDNAAIVRAFESGIDSPAPPALR